MNANVLRGRERGKEETQAKEWSPSIIDDLATNLILRRQLKDFLSANGDGIWRQAR